MIPFGLDYGVLYYSIILVVLLVLMLQREVKLYVKVVGVQVISLDKMVVEFLAGMLEI